jgi:predicted HicB family RNase H-like nuclease
MEKHSFGQELKENHEMTELELFRKEIVQKDGYIDLLKKNIADQQEEIHHLQLRVKALLDAQHN